MLAAASREGIRCWKTGAHRDAAPMNGEYPLALPVEFGEFPEWFGIERCTSDARLIGAHLVFAAGL